MGVLDGLTPLQNLRFKDDGLPTDTSFDQVEYQKKKKKSGTHFLLIFKCKKKKLRNEQRNQCLRNSFLMRPTI